MAFDQPQHHESHHHDADLCRQQHPARDLQRRVMAADCVAQPARLARRHGGDEEGEEPEADHHHHEDVVFARQMPRNAVLQGKDQGGGDHQPDAQPGVLLGHAGTCAAGRRP